jgi:phosphatidate cytidylyltransferase
VSDAAATKSDLGTRFVSAVVMLVVACTALWLGGWWWRSFVTVIGIGVLWEWTRLSRKFSKSNGAFTLWMVAGVLYLGLACLSLAILGSNTTTGDHWSRFFLIAILALVVGTDVGAYFAGRTFGGPKIAPAISPSKTWAGLLGGVVGAFAMLLLWAHLTAAGALLSLQGFPVAGLFSDWREAVVPCLVTGAIGAVIAQAGDFFESWMKRRAGVKDSSKLIPGHGGLFVRTDGLIAVAFAYFVPTLAGIDWFLM